MSTKRAKVKIALLGRLMNHWRARPDKVDPKPLHMQASRISRGSGMVIILCLYCATCSLGSIVPSYNFMARIVRCFGISTKAMASANGQSAWLVKAAFSTGLGTPEIFRIISSTFLRRSYKGYVMTADGATFGMLGTGCLLRASSTGLGCSAATLDGGSVWGGCSSNLPVSSSSTHR